LKIHRRKRCTTVKHIITNGDKSGRKSDGRNGNVSSLLTPYLNTSTSGVNYIDASTLQGTAKDKTAIIQEATKEGIKVITNKNTAAD
jgi:hypothetical protein